MGQNNYYKLQELNTSAIEIEGVEKATTSISTTNIAGRPIVKMIQNYIILDGQKNYKR